MREVSNEILRLTLLDCSRGHGNDDWRTIPSSPAGASANQIKSKTRLRKTFRLQSAGTDRSTFRETQHDADELAAPAQSILSDVDRTTQGTLPKDLSTKLKRIETLAKQLRNGLNP